MVCLGPTACGDDDDEEASPPTPSETSTAEATAVEIPQVTESASAVATPVTPFTAGNCPASVAADADLCDFLVALANALVNRDEAAVADLSTQTTAECPHDFLLDEQAEELICTDPPPNPLPVGYAINRGNEGYSQLLPLPDYTDRIAGFVDNINDAASDDRGAGALDVLLVEDCRNEFPNSPFLSLHATAIVDHPEFGADRVVFIPRVEQVDGEWRVTFFGAYLVSAAEQFGVDLFDYRCPTDDWL
jgi:hypothetical protein